MSQTYIIELKRGLKANLPTTDTHIGQPYFCTDTGELFVWNGTTMAQVSGGTTAFSSLAGGVNTSATMTVGSGASIVSSGDGVIDATEINGVPFTNTNPSLGKIPIGQGDGSAAWADPFVQGTQAVGTAVSTINPVLIGGSDYAGSPLLRNIKVDASGNIYIGGTVTVSGPLTDTQLRATPVPVSGAISFTAPQHVVVDSGAITVAGTVAFSNSTIAVTNTGIFAVQADVTKLAGTALSAPTAAGVPPTGQEVAPTVRPISRKYSWIQTTTPLLANTTYTSEWFDTNADGVTSIQAGGQGVGGTQVANGFRIEATNDTTDAAMLVVLAQVSSYPTNYTQNTNIAAVVPYRYWRVVWQNGAGNQSSFKLVCTVSSTTRVQLEGQIPSSVQQGFSTLPVAFGYATGWADNTYAPYPVVPPGGNSGFGAPMFAMGVMGTGAIYQGVQILRTPNIFKTATATTSGNTAVWTPTSGKKFRLMRYIVEVPADAVAASGADLDITFQDSTTNIGVGNTCFIPASAGTTFGAGYSSGWIDLGNGKLSAAANNVLNINLSLALTGSKVRVTVCGTEE